MANFSENLVAIVSIFLLSMALHAIWSYNERWDFPRAGSSLFLPRFSGLTFLRFLGPFFIFSEIFAKCVSPFIGNSVLHSVMFTLKNKNKEICKEKFKLMYVQVKDISKVSKLEKNLAVL